MYYNFIYIILTSMGEFLGIIMLVFGGIASLLPIIGIAVLIIMLLRKNNKEDTKGKSTQLLSFKNLLKTYLYIIISLSMFISLIGFTFLGKAGLGLIDKNFSYAYETASVNYDGGTIKPIPPIYYEEDYYNYDDSVQNDMIYDDTTNESYYCYGDDQELIMIDGKYYCHNPLAVQLDLINGITIVVSTMLIFIMHFILLFKIESNEPSMNLRKYFIFSNLMVYSLMGIVTLPIAIYSLFNYILMATKPVTYNDVPGGILAFVVFTLITWAVWLIAMLKNRNTKQEK